MIDHQLGLSLVFNGAIYNYPELRTELQALGYQFHSDGDTEVLLKGYHAWGEQLLPKLNGMFAFAIHDHARGCLFLARDRLGVTRAKEAVLGGINERGLSELHDLLEAAGVSVWFSEKDILPGVPFLRAIDKGLANSRIGFVMVTPALMTRIQAEGVADKELSALLAGNLLVPVVHGITFDEVRAVSPLLASRNGFDTGVDSLEVIAVKIAELVDFTRPVDA